MKVEVARMGPKERAKIMKVEMVKPLGARMEPREKAKIMTVEMVKPLGARKE